MIIGTVPPPAPKALTMAPAGLTAPANGLAAAPLGAAANVPDTASAATAAALPRGAVSASTGAAAGAAALGAVAAVEPGIAPKPVFLFTGIKTGDTLPLRGGTVWNGSQYKVAGGTVKVEEYGPQRMKSFMKMKVETGWFGIKVTRHLHSDMRLLDDGMVRIDRLETDEKGVPKPQDPKDPDRPQILEVMSVSPTKTVLKPRFAIELRDGKEVRVPWDQPEMTLVRKPGNILVINAQEVVGGNPRHFRFEIGLTGA